MSKNYRACGPQIKLPRPIKWNLYFFHSNGYCCLQSRDILKVNTNFNNHISGLSFEVYNGFLGQLAQKWQLVKVQSVWKTSVVLSKLDLFWLWRAAIFEPVHLRKRFIPQRKALKYGIWKLQSKFDYLLFANLQTNSSEHDAFSVKWEWQPIRCYNAYSFPKF